MPKLLHSARRHVANRCRALGWYLAERLRRPKSLTRVEARTLSEAAYYMQHGFEPEYHERGNRVWMVRRA